MRKLTITVILALFLALTSQAKVQSITKPVQDSEELRLQDMLMLFLQPHIMDAVGDYYYPQILNFKPYVNPWDIEVIQTKRVNDFRGFLFEITLLVEPSDGGHNVKVGKDCITFQISVRPSVKLVKYKHLATYELPPDLIK
ncbi:Protein of unknown function [Bacillus sp. OV166]|uniref:DUF3888 domain-containing protein n=1 Tax=Bacillus sp. OV166 TaxID=1882763 RepID=UPI000A2AEBCE|nr:DUF3888 domain-containing protein [Bacillus sp. OV166]SMQ80596.1 Protein of unknown function [Bacillus sp. OV166]